MANRSEADRDEIPAIIDTLQGIIAKLDAIGRKIEGSHISMAVDLLKSFYQGASGPADKPNLH